MKRIIDKLVILIITLAVYIPIENSIYKIVPILIIIALSALLSYLENDRITISVSTAYIILCLYKPIFLCFFPLICYDAAFSKIKWAWGLTLLPLFLSFTEPYFISQWLLAALIIAAHVLKHRTLSLENLEADYYKLRDNTKEISMKLEKQNKELLDKQDYEINVATLSERNRIARDIHDNVGHLLSRSILQIGALLAINREEMTKESLRLVKDTLSEAMDSIRSSVHNLHEESLDLHTEIQKLVDNFKFCPIKLDYEMETSLEKNLKYCFIAVIKEALSNIIKHSDATMVTLIIREHPAFYQLVIQDNGTSSSSISENGIGLKNISDRVFSVKGNVNISTDNGFRIFISIPKK
jgi:signal transduction histidine kinase